MWSSPVHLPPLYGGGFWLAFSQVSLAYYLVAVLLHYAIPAVVPVKSIQRGERRQGQVAREALLSIGPLMIKAAALAISEELLRSGRSLLYSSPLESPSSWAYALLTIVVLDYTHDAWFYWMHRLLHWGPLYRHVHYLHHQSSVPTPFAGYSFHILEGVMIFASIPLFCYCLPIHIGLQRVYLLHSIAMHTAGHAGYELAPFIPTVEGIIALCVSGHQRPADALNTVQHHDMHHRYPRTNFSLYMTHWDRLMGTEHASYKDTVEKNFRAAKTPKA